MSCFYHYFALSQLFTTVDTFSSISLITEYSFLINEWKPLPSYKGLKWNNETFIKLQYN